MCFGQLILMRAEIVGTNPRPPLRSPACALRTTTARGTSGQTGNARITLRVLEHPDREELDQRAPRHFEFSKWAVLRVHFAPTAVRADC